VTRRRRRVSLPDGQPGVVLLLLLSQQVPDLLQGLVGGAGEVGRAGESACDGASEPRASRCCCFHCSHQGSARVQARQHREPRLRGRRRRRLRDARHPDTLRRISRPAESRSATMTVDHAASRGDSPGVCPAERAPRSIPAAWAARCVGLRVRGGEEQTASSVLGWGSLPLSYRWRIRYGS
jgi:hypothetical protein